MASYHNKLDCQRAKDYYYIYLAGDNRTEIPGDITMHIDNCRNCQEQIEKLKNKIDSLGTIVNTQDNPDSILLSNLELHFNYINKHITCDTAKPFLPILATKNLNITVRTPITDHIDKCNECSKDLDTIISLGLSDKQLYILGQCYASSNKTNNEVCNQTLKYIDKLYRLDFESIPTDTLKHICTCPTCSLLFQKTRDDLFESSEETTNILSTPCESIKITDLFDFVTPYGIDFSDEKYIKLHKSLASHLINCKRCLSMMNLLHHQIYAIQQRPDLGVSTIFNHNNSFLCDELNIENCRPNPIKIKTTEINWTSFFKPFATVAAILLFAFVLFQTSKVEAVDITQMYKALSYVNHVHITNYSSETSSVINEIWISPSSNIKIAENSRGCTLWDIRRKQVKSRKDGEGNVEMTNLNEDQISQINKTMAAPWNLLPFRTPGDLPKNAMWQQISDEKINVQYPHSEIYDLVWTHTNSLDSTAWYKIRCYIDVESHLPTRTEFFEKYVIDGDYELTNFKKINYLTKEQFQNTIKDLGF